MRPLTPRMVTLLNLITRYGALNAPLITTLARDIDRFAPDLGTLRACVRRGLLAPVTVGATTMYHRVTQ